MKNRFNSRRIIFILRLSSKMFIFIWSVLINKDRIDPLLLINICTHNFQYYWLSPCVFFHFLFGVFPVWIILKYFICLNEWWIILQSLFSHHHNLVLTGSHFFFVFKLVFNNGLLYFWNLLGTYRVPFLWK